MSGIESGCGSRFGVDKLAEDAAEAVAAIAHGEEIEMVPGPCATPSGGDGSGGLVGGQSAFKFVRDDQDGERHGAE
jgi:hypothetical protein